MRRARGVALVALLVLVSCGGDDDEAARPQTTVSTAPATTTTTTSTTLPASGPVRLESRQYPYALTVDVARLVGPFDPASQAWDGESRIIRDASTVDWIPLSGAQLFLVGLAWSGDLASFAQMFVDHSADRNGCSQAHGQREVTLADTPVLVFTVDACGNEDAAFARAALLRDGFGLIVFVETSMGRESQSIDNLLGALAGFEWR